MSFNTASAILRGGWFIHKEWADSNMALVMKMIKGESIDFGMKRDESLDAKVLSIKSAAAVYEVGYYSKLDSIPFGSVAMINIMGPVTKFGDMCSYGMIEYAETINRVASAPNIAGIIVNVDSPGGQAYGTTMLADTIRAAASQKPVIGVVDDGIAASAGLWILLSCTEVYVTKKTDQVGSCGVYCAIADWYGYFESEGLKIHDVYAPQSTDKNASFSEAIAGNDQKLQDELKVLAAAFISAVQTSRGDRLTSTDWQTGKMFYATDAAKIGLIDGIMSMDKIFKRMDSLIKQTNQSSNNSVMKYPKTSAVAKTEDFQALVPGVATEVAEAGVFVPEAAIGHIEAALTLSDAVNATLTQTQGELATANTSLATANANLQTANATIATLTAEIAALKKEDAGTGAEGGAKTEDAFPKKDTAASDMAFQKELLLKVD